MMLTTTSVSISVKPAAYGCDPAPDEQYRRLILLFLSLGSVGSYPWVWHVTFSIALQVPFLPLIHMAKTVTFSPTVSTIEFHILSRILPSSLHRESGPRTSSSLSVFRFGPDSLPSPLILRGGYLLANVSVHISYCDIYRIRAGACPFVIHCSSSKCEISVRDRMPGTLPAVIAAGILSHLVAICKELDL